MKHFFRIIILLLITIPAFSQQKLSPEDLQRLQKRAEEYVYNFEYYIKQISKMENMQDKQWDIIAALNLFESNANIEVSNLNGNKYKYLISDYLKNVVAKYSQWYEVVVIDFTVTEIGKLKQKIDVNGDTIYEGTFKYTQLFCAKLKSFNKTDIENRSFSACVNSDYSDKTVKKGKVIVRHVTTIEKGESWIMKLSDISVVETSELNSPTK